MEYWQLQEAKNRFSELVKKAVGSGPQIVKKRGVDLINRFSGRILGIGLDESKKWGEIQAIAKKS